MIKIRASQKYIKLKRESSQPIKEKTSGSTFKNPFGEVDGSTSKAVRSGGAAYEDKQLGYIIINTQGNENATVEMCFKKPCNTKDADGNYTNILKMSVALQ